LLQFIESQAQGNPQAAEKLNQQPAGERQPALGPFLYGRLPKNRGNFVAKLTAESGRVKVQYPA
jgi:hypothetical protein